MQTETALGDNMLVYLIELMMSKLKRVTVSNTSVVHDGVVFVLPTCTLGSFNHARLSAHESLQSIKSQQ